MLFRSHHIHHYGKIRFNETKKTLGVSEKVLSQQLKELTHDGLVQRIQYNTIPLKVEYILTPLGEDLIPALDILYIWSIRRLTDLNLPVPRRETRCFRNVLLPGQALASAVSATWSCNIRILRKPQIGRAHV